ncbi:InlB B-repeat-containing protein [Carnobacteriaceae bacterium zg-C25]|nr:InlB B-repeat-containing protein [Carnobacteriaceae bacterium zg-C25]
MKTVNKKCLVWLTVLMLVAQSTNVFGPLITFAQEQHTEHVNRIRTSDNIDNVSDADTVEQELQATIYQDASYQEVAEDVSVITLRGKMPRGAIVKAYPAEVPSGNETVLFAYDITIYDASGRVFNPKESDSIQVSVSNPIFEDASNIKIYHVEGDTQQKEEVTPKAAKDDTVTFDAKSFSVYIGTGLSNHNVHTYRFYDEQGREQYVRRLSTGEKLSKPPTTYKDGYVFTGWYTAQTGGTKFADNRFTVEGPLRTNRETKLYARYEKAYFVRYLSKSEQGSPAWFTQKYPRSDGNDVLDFKNIPFVADDGKVLTGWSRTLDGRTPVAEGTPVTSDMDLYPIVQSARWIYFETNGAESLSPVYILQNQQNKTKKPADPVRQGYTFAGWFADKELKVPFNWDARPQRDTTIYAKWTPSKTSYTIVYWKQKVTHPLGQPDPNREDYDYWKSTVVSNVDTGSTTPTSVALENERGFGFVRAESNYDKIKGDGSTIINVYYDRKVVTVNYYVANETRPFYVSRGIWESPITDFPELQSGTPNFRFDTGRTSSTVAATTYWPDFKFEDRHMRDIANYIVHLRYTSPINERNAYTIYWHVQEPDGSYRLVHGQKAELSGARFTLTNKFRGYELVSASYHNANRFFPVSERSSLEPNRIGYDVRLNRKRYTIDYKYGNAITVGNKTNVPYGATLDTTYNLAEPSRPADIPSHYVWKGWALDPAGSKFIKFDGSYKMDASNLVLYAIWKPVDVTVTFDSNGGTPVSSLPLASGDSAQKPTDPTRPNYRFAGWKLNGNLYNFNSEVNRNITLVAQWIPTTVANLYYHPNTATGETKKATNSDFPDVDGKVEKIESSWGWTAPDTSEGFVSWNTKADGTGITYYPGDAITLPAGDTHLYAQWSENRKVDVTYHFNYPSLYSSQQPNSLVQQFEANDDNAKIGGSNPTRFFGDKLSLVGYKFLGWSTQPTANGEIAQIGDKFHVDTLNKENANVLYARWQREALITVKKEVDGNQIDNNTPNREFTFHYKIHLPGSVFESRSSINGSFTLRPGETKTLEQITADQTDPSKRFTVLPEGAGIRIAEVKNDHVQNVETWKFALNNPNIMEKKPLGSLADRNGIKIWEYEVDGASDNAHVVFKNTKIASPPTGLFFDSVPAMLLSGFALVAIFYIVVSQRRGRHYDD